MPVVLLHGLGVSSRYFRSLASLLSRDRLVLAPDLPGTGLSEHPRHILGVRELSDTLGAWLDEATRETLALLPIVVRDYLRFGLRRFFHTARAALAQDFAGLLPHVRGSGWPGSRLSCRTVRPQRSRAQRTRRRSAPRTRSPLWCGRS